ncbi:dockerin type I domain-containing protein [Planctomycetaceae bacterium SH139]
MNWEIPQFAGQGMVALTSDHALDSGGQGLVFQASEEAPNAEALNEIILHLDLSQAESPLLSFHQLEGLFGTNWGDINEPLADFHLISDPNSRPVEAYGDGLSISADGVHWYRLLDLEGGDINRGGDGLWQFHEYDLQANVDRLNGGSDPAGISLNGNVQIKFSQLGDRQFPHRGWVIDRVSVTDTETSFTTDLDRGVFHRFGLAGESRTDFMYRVALIGDVGPDTPVLVGVHGRGGAIESYTHRWLRIAADPDNSVEDLIIVAPWFRVGGRYHSYNHLNWEYDSGRTADQVLIDILADLEDQGMGQTDQIKLFGYSGGGQFSQRFATAHPDRVAAVVVGAPSSHAVPDFVKPYPYGLADNPAEPRPVDVDFDLPAVLRTPTMFWVGQDDSFVPPECQPPIQSSCNLDLSGPAQSQGEGRLQRALNVFEDYVALANDLQIDSSERLHRFMVGEGYGHNYGQSVRQNWYDFLFRDVSQIAREVVVSPAVVLTASSEQQSQQLPQHIDLVEPGKEFWLEVWANSQSAVGNGIEEASLEIYFDQRRAGVVEVEVGQAFTDQGSTVIDQSAGRIRSLAVTAKNPGAGVGEHALLARVRFEATSQAQADSQIALAIQTTSQDWELNAGESIVPVIAAVPKLDLQTSADKAMIYGSAILDADYDGQVGGHENGLAGVPVTLRTAAGEIALRGGNHEPDDYVAGTILNSVSDAAVLSAVGTTVVGTAVRAGERDTASTGGHVFSHRTETTWQSFWRLDAGALRVDFPTLASEVEIDIVAGSNGSTRRGRLLIYNSAGELLAETTSDALTSGNFQTLSLSRAQQDIAYAVVGGYQSSVRLDNLRYVTRATAVSDQAGQFAIRGVTPGEYQLHVTPPQNYSVTGVAGNPRVVELSPGEVTSREDFTIAAPLVLVEQVEINQGQSQRSMVEQLEITFSEEVELMEGAIEVTRRDGVGGSVDLMIDTSVVNGRTVAKITFTGSQTRHGSLVDGNYQLQLKQDHIRSLRGGMLDGDSDGVAGGDHYFGNDATDKFFRLFGDSNGDRLVNFIDFLAFRNAFGSDSSEPEYQAALDENGDGVINFIDFLQFRSRFGGQLEF